ncbi:hypothetical protein DdX_00921 [Ditylenchus destructor]|uniref:Uncharacterized protein n=1 Tax=Ditylenchus destructor TaxID=166010 RepID=A0AAD4NG20_9BILA|nr:hypothetical protein DdX_00921 [Ditylenchus destructor]
MIHCLLQYLTFTIFFGYSLAFFGQGGGNRVGGLFGGLFGGPNQHGRNQEVSSSASEDSHDSEFGAAGYGSPGIGPPGGFGQMGSYGQSGNEKGRGIRVKGGRKGDGHKHGGSFGRGEGPPSFGGQSPSFGGPSPSFGGPSLSFGGPSPFGQSGRFGRGRGSGSSSEEMESF